ncbi:MAG TPA: MaoC/PaaZ C-terminal domain-containing protein [Xanthobacteraceae bacterium]|jgi:acyl dehydratase|nr:MaoC/PaaZ C-terminal domain-containing protein [Xanthobacteraceae bacterium]
MHSFESLKPGQTFSSNARTLTETDLVMFCMMMGDWHAIHADEQYAKDTRIGRRMFHGTFGISLAIAQSADLLPLSNRIIAALGIKDWSFKAPLFIGDTVHTELVIAGTRVASDGRRGVLSRTLRLVKHDATVAQEGLAELLVELEAGGNAREQST